MRILVADDDRLVRTMLNKVLRDWGHTVQLAEDGQQAWDYIKDHRLDCVISDWLMPNMNGVELCRHIRDLDSRAYIYTILLTSKSENADLVEAFQAGADDFVGKPVNFDVLKARIAAGERIIRLEQDLATRNKKLEESNKQLEEARSEIQRDLEAGAAMQRSLLPPPSMRIGDYRIEWLYKPHSVVSGDIFNVVQMNDEYLSFYLLDVSGHGVPSALLTVTINKMLSSRSHEVNPIYNSRTNKLVSTGTVLRELNTRFQLEEDSSQYFTIIFGLLNLKTGDFEFAQAGHPPPIIQSKDGSGQMVGDGGFPIGWLPELDFDNVAMNLDRGGRIVLYSDGISECTNPEGEMYGGERLINYFKKTKGVSLSKAMSGMIDELKTWKSGVPFNDDISLLAIERVPESESAEVLEDTYTDEMSPAAS